MLVTPDLITDACIAILETKHDEHLAALERQRSLAPQTIQPLATVDLLAAGGVRLREHKPPAALLAIFGVLEPPELQKDGTLAFAWYLAVQIVVVGQDAEDTLRRRDWYSMTVAECLLSRLARDTDLVDQLRLTDVDFQNGTTDEARARTVGEAQLSFRVVARETLDTHVLPSATTVIPAGTPGGPPETPYDPPVPWPVADPVTADIGQQ